MNCDRARDLTLLFLCGELAEEEAEVLRPHLMACPDCARQMGELRRALRAVAGTTEAEPSPEFTERTRRTIGQGLRAPRPVAKRAAERAPLFPRVAGLVAAAMVFFALRYGSPPLPDTGYDVSHAIAPASERPQAAFEIWDPWWNDTLDGLRDRLAAVQPVAAAVLDDDDESDGWTDDVEQWTRTAEILAWEMTDGGLTRWSSDVEEIRARMDEMANDLERG